MFKRSETILALVPPAIAVGWVIADAATGLVAADRRLQTPPPTVQIVRSVETAAVATPNTKPRGIVFCGRNRQSVHGLSQAAVQRLCRAGSKLTSDLPKS